MDALVPRDRHALELRAAGLSVGEIAESLGVTYKVAEHALGRARSGMKAIWRATAGAVGLLWGSRARPRQAVAVGALALAGAVLAVGWRVMPTIQRDDRVSSTAVVTTVAPSPAEVRSISPTSPPGSKRLLASTARHSRAIATVPAVRAGGLYAVAGSLEERPHGESLQQVVERCLRHVTVRPDHVECDG
jgi:hypothetical protein